MGRKRFIDLSLSIEPDLPSDPPIMIPKIDYVTHAQGAEQMKDFFRESKKGNCREGSAGPSSF